MKYINLLSALPKSKYYILAAIGVGVCVAGGSLVWARQTGVKPVSQEIPIVRTAIVGSAGTSQGYSYSGEVRGRFESQLAFQVGGKIVKRNVQLGSKVSAGDVLMQIDSRDLQQTVNTNSAQVSSAESQLKLAESNLNRYRQLYETGAISRAQYDQHVNSYEVALASLRQASAQYAQGSNQLDYSLLQADKPGVVSAITAEIGQVVAAGQIVVTVVQDGEREIEITVPENRLEELQKSRQIQVTFWALPNITLKGKVREVSPMADQTTRTFKVRISLLDSPPEIKLGMTATVALADSTKQPALTIPLAAVYQDGDSPKVWIVKDNTLSLSPIQTGDFGNGSIQVTGGLQAGDTIVIAGVHKLREGQKVKTGADSL